MSTKINLQLEKIVVEWLRANKLSINIKKTQFMIISNEKNIDNLILIINGIQIDRIYVSKFWGLLIDF